METAQSVINEGLESLVKDPAATKDFTEETDALLQLDLPAAYEKLLLLERKARNAGDSKNVTRIIQKILQHFHESGDFEKLYDHVSVSLKKRGQLKKVVSEVVETCIQWIETFSGAEKLRFIQVLSEITNGKMFVEVQKARLTKMECDILEESGKIEEAANLIQDVPVETFGAMEASAKVDYILEQMRLVLKKGDHERCRIVSRKIRQDLLKGQQKTTFYEYLIVIELVEENFCKVANSCLKIYEVTQNLELIERSACYFLLSENAGDLENLRKTYTKEFDSLEKIKPIVDEFLYDEIMDWPFSFEEYLKTSQILSTHLELLQKRVVQKNLKVVAGYYSRIDLQKLAEMLRLDRDETEKALCEMISNKMIEAKIDRPAGICDFQKNLRHETVLNNWSEGASKLFSLVERNCHLIHLVKVMAANETTTETTTTP